MCFKCEPFYCPCGKDCCVPGIPGRDHATGPHSGSYPEALASAYDPDTDDAPPAKRPRLPADGLPAQPQPAPRPKLSAAEEARRLFAKYKPERDAALRASQRVAARSAAASGVDRSSRANANREADASAVHQSATGTRSTSNARSSSQSQPRPEPTASRAITSTVLSSGASSALVPFNSAAPALAASIPSARSRASSRPAAPAAPAPAAVPAAAARTSAATNAALRDRRERENIPPDDGRLQGGARQSRAASEAAPAQGQSDNSKRTTKSAKPVLAEVPVNTVNESAPAGGRRKRKREVPTGEERVFEILVEWRRDLEDLIAEPESLDGGHARMMAKIKEMADLLELDHLRNSGLHITLSIIGKMGSTFGSDRNGIVNKAADLIVFFRIKFGSRALKM